MKFKKPKDRLPDRGNGYPYGGQNGYGYPQNGYDGYSQDGYQNNGYGGYQQDGYNNGYGYPNGYQNGYGGYGGYPGYGYPGYGYPGYPGYGYPGYGGYGGYGGYPQMNYIADSYPQEDYSGTDASSTGTNTSDQSGSGYSSETAQPAQEAPPPAPEPEPKPAPTPPAPEPAQQTPSSYAADSSYGSETASTGSDTGVSAGDADSLKAEAEDLKRKWYSVTAEYENYRKRTQNTKQEAYQEGRADVVKKLFPIGDNLDRAVRTCQDETTKKGINMVLSAFEKVLEGENITAINPVGKPFDPNECEAIMAVEAQPGQQSGIVTEVYVKGYMQNEKVLRYAQLIVTK